MSLFKGLSDLTKLIGSSVGNNLDNEEEDVRTIRDSFKEIDFTRDDQHETDEDDKPLGFITRGLDNTIKGFQRKNNLREDGYITPGGETEKTLAQELQKKYSGIFENGELEEEEEEEEKTAHNPFSLTRGGLSVNKDKIAEDLGKILLAEAGETPTHTKQPEAEGKKDEKEITLINLQAKLFIAERQIERAEKEKKIFEIEKRQQEYDLEQVLKVIKKEKKEKINAKVGGGIAGSAIGAGLGSITGLGSAALLASAGLSAGGYIGIGVEEIGDAISKSSETDFTLDIKNKKLRNEIKNTSNKIIDINHRIDFELNPEINRIKKKIEALRN